MIKRVSRDGAIGYILTADGKKLTEHLYHMNYQDDSRQYDIKRRMRKRQFAYLYALFDRAGIPFEQFAKPSISEISVQDSKVFFYTGLDFKRMLGIESNIFKGSRLLGVFAGRGRVFPVYRTNRVIKTFGRHESLVPEFMKRYFSVPVYSAILICDDARAVIDITSQIIDNSDNDYKKGVNTAKYRYFYVFPSDDSFYSHFEDIYTDHSELLQRLIKENHIETSDRDDEGRYRLKIGTGFYKDDPVWICPGNVDVVTLKLFIRNAIHNNRRNYIFSQDRDLEMLREITKNSMSILVGPIREG